MVEISDCPSPLGKEADKGLINQWWRTAALAQKGLAPLLSRYATHLMVVLLVTVALSLTGMELPSTYDYLNTPTPAPHLGERDLEPVTSRGGRRTDLSGGLLLSAPVLRTSFTEPPITESPITESPTAEPPTPTVAPPVEENVLPLPALPLPSLLPAANPEAKIEEATRREVITYTVRSGDTVSGIAAYFGLSPDTLVWSNPSIEPAPDLLKLGQELTILPVDGAYHTVVGGDTLESIAKYYKVAIEDVVNYELNHVSDDGRLTVGLKLVIPGGKKPYIPRVVEHYKGPVPEDAKRGTGAFGWPASGRITQGFWEGHKATDIGGPSGTPIYAADSGWVARAGQSEVGYGKMILIDHVNGFQSLYAHLSVILVEEGTSVAKGTLIGRMGSTGNTTGPHLHLEIRENGKQRNPLIYLPNS